MRIKRNELYIVFVTAFLLWGSACSPTSSVGPHLTLEAPIYMSADATGELFIYGYVVNDGGAVAHDGNVITIVNGGECIFAYYMGEFAPGERKRFEQVLYGYSKGDNISLKFRTEWRNNE